MTLRVLGVDLASASWRDNGTALLSFSADGWHSVDVGVISWPTSGRPDATTLAAAIDGYCKEHRVVAVSLDGPQGWRDPAAGPGWGRASDRAARTPGKMGPPRTCVPGTYIGWVSLCVEVFDCLLTHPHAELVNGSALRLSPRPEGSYYVLECFPTSIWRTAGLAVLPGKAKTTSTAPFATALADRFGLPPLSETIGHDDLQAVVAGLPAAGLLGAPIEAVPRGEPARLTGTDRVEGIIWDARPVGAARIAPGRGDSAHAARPMLIVVTGPPGAGKSTLAAAISERLALPLIAKDPLKETLHDALGGDGRDWSQRLGRATFEVIFHVIDRLLEAGVSVMAEGNFATAEGFRRLPEARVVQIHVTAAPEVLRERFAARGGRHPVHYDAHVVDEVPARARAGEWGPIDLSGELIEVTTDHDPDPSAEADRIVTNIRASA